jgi:hypothetical protein
MVTAAALQSTVPSPANPSKEYIYAGGRLLATEEPFSTANLTNAALGKTATQSSYPAGQTAGRAVDGNTDGVYANGSVTYTTIEAQAWWQVDLGSSQSINHIRVWNRVESPSRTSNFYVFVSDNPFTSTDLTTTQNQVGVSSYLTPGQCDFPTIIGVNRTGRYVRVQLVGTNYLQLAEVEVWSGGTGQPPSGGASTENVVWTNAVGVTVTANNLTKTAASGWGNSGASSTRAIASGDGYVEFKAEEANTYRMCGLSNGDTNQNYLEPDFVIYLQGSGSIAIYEKGASKGSFGAYAGGETFRVAVEGGVIKYYKDGVLLYTSTSAPTYPLLVDTALYTNGATIKNAVISGTLTP